MHSSQNNLSQSFDVSSSDMVQMRSWSDEKVLSDITHTLKAELYISVFIGNYVILPQESFRSDSFVYLIFCFMKMWQIIPKQAINFFFYESLLQGTFWHCFLSNPVPCCLHVHLNFSILIDNLHIYCKPEERDKTFYECW